MVLCAAGNKDCGSISGFPLGLTKHLAAILPYPTYSRSSIFFTSLGGKDLQATFDRCYWRIHRHNSGWGAVTNVNGIGEGTEVTSAGKIAIMNYGGSIPIPMLCN